MGEASENHSIDYNGAEMEVGFNAKYIPTSFAVETDRVLFEMKDEATQRCPADGRPSEKKAKAARKRKEPRPGGEYNYVGMP
jgi:DNA polymerase III sliding clamp (beta) subunit (PCNA family)